MYNTHRNGGFTVLKILICDDDKQILSQVQSLINRIEKEKNIEFSIDSHTNADFIIHENICYDIAIIDIEMPGISGLKLSEKLKELNQYVIVIILTSFSDYLDQAMKINVFRYLSKPIDINRFNKNFLEAIDYYKHISKEIVIENYDEIYRIKTREILYIENKKHGSFIVTEKHKFTTNKKPLEWLKIINQPNCFVYSHKSFVVNLQNIINFNRNVITFKTSTDPLEVNCISQRKYLEFKKSFFDFAGGIQ